MPATVAITQDDPPVRADPPDPRQGGRQEAKAEGGATAVARLALLIALVAGCAPTLKPAPYANAVGGRGQGVVGSAAGVRLVAHADAWRGRPPALSSVVTPILVTVENDGLHPLRLRYDHFALTAVDGRRLAARAPSDIEGAVSEPSAHPRPGLVFPGIIGSIRGGTVYADPFYDPFLADRLTPDFDRVELPTGDMVQFALPQQTLEPGGRISGFLYFDRVDRPASRIDLTFDLVDARTGERFGAVGIPFVAD